MIRVLIYEIEDENSNFEERNLKFQFKRKQNKWKAKKKKNKKSDISWESPTFTPNISQEIIRTKIKMNRKQPSKDKKKFGFFFFHLFLEEWPNWRVDVVFFFFLRFLVLKKQKLNIIKKNA